MDWRDTRFVVTTYRKLAKGESGMTRLGTRKIDALAAFDWIIQELPDEAVEVTDDGADTVTLTVHRDAFGELPDA